MLAAHASVGGACDSPLFKRSGSGRGAPEDPAPLQDARVVLADGSGDHSMRGNSADWRGALKDNLEMWKVALPLLLSILIVGTVAGFAIDLALDDPITFVAWSILCFVAGAGAHWRWRKPKPAAPSEWS